MTAFEKAAYEAAMRLGMKDIRDIKGKFNVALLPNYKRVSTDRRMELGYLRGLMKAGARPETHFEWVR